MKVNDTDSQWKRWGKEEPYFGVLTEEKFLSANLSLESKAEFFDSGKDYIHHVLERVRQHTVPGFIPKRVLDFGCGVGRLVVPLSEIAREVIGMDVSDSMLDEARINCRERGIENASFVLSDDAFSMIDGEFNFIHSFIVFQHIPVKKGEKLFGSLLSYLSDDGVCVVHFTYARPEKRGLRKFASWLRAHIPLAREIANTVRGKKMSAPEMQMNPYDLNRIALLMEENNVANYYTEFIRHGAGIRGVLLYFQKESDQNRDPKSVLNVAREH